MSTISRRSLLKTMTAATSLAIIPLSASAGQSIEWSALRGDDKDFHRAPVLLTGEKDAILIDGSFNYGAGTELVEKIRASGKRLTTIYVSVNDPDYYFSLKPVKEAFPEARVVAASETIKKIRQKVQNKLDVWGPVLGEYGPQTQDDVVFPEADDTSTLTLEGETIEIITSETMEDRRYLWSPSLQAVFGGVYVFDGLHVWTADTPTPQDRANWIAELDSLIARNPKIVVAGHAAQGTNNGVESLKFTREYLLAYEDEVKKAANSDELIAAMKKLYPDLGLLPALEIGAKVAKGEMKWS
ncbi:MAG: MBL fold metallo-hydrolase [Pseudomonadota bacterium]